MNPKGKGRKARSVFRGDAAVAAMSKVLADAKAMGACGGILRADAGETMAFLRSLESIEAQTYNYLYGQIRWRNVFPTKNVPGWADQSTYRMMDRTGKAKVIDDHASDLPRVGLWGDETKQVMRRIGLGFSYSLDDIAKSVYLGEPIDAAAAVAAREELERLTDELCATGGSGIPSFLGNASLSSIAASAAWYKISTASKVVATTWQSIIGDVGKMIAVANNATLNAFESSAWTLVLPTALYNWAMTTPVVDTGFLGPTLATYILQSVPQLDAIELWPRLDTADSGNPMPLLIPRDPMVINALVGEDFRMLPPEPRNLAFAVNCTMKVGGVELKYPKAVVKLTGSTQA